MKTQKPNWPLPNLQDTSPVQISIEVICGVLIVFLFAAVIIATAFFATGCGAAPALQTRQQPQPAVSDNLGATTGRHVGMGYYGMMSKSWPCAKSLSVMKGQNRPSVSVVWNIFGRNLTCLKKFIADPRHKVVEIHLVNACCQRNGNCQSYDFLNNISSSKEHSLISSNNNQFRKALLQYIAPISKLVTDSIHTNTRFIISPELESNLSCSDGERLISWLKPAFPAGTQFAWAAIQGCRPAGADFREYHGYISGVSAPCTANLDGNDIALPISGRHTSSSYKHIEYNQVDDYIRNTSNCAISHLWTYESNGGTYNYSNPDRRARTNWPSDAVFDALAPFLK